MKTLHTQAYVRIFAFIGALGTGVAMMIGGSLLEGVGIIAAAVSSPLASK